MFCAGYTEQKLLDLFSSEMTLEFSMDTQTYREAEHDASSLAQTQRSRIGSLIEKHALGSAGFCVLIILALTCVSGSTDAPLQCSLWFACAGIPLFLSLYIAEDEIEALRQSTDEKWDKALTLVTCVSFIALLLLAASIALLAAHRSKFFGYVFFLAIVSSPWLSAALRKIAT